MSMPNQVFFRWIAIIWWKKKLSAHLPALELVMRSNTRRFRWPKMLRIDVVFLMGIKVSVFTSHRWFFEHFWRTDIEFYPNVNPNVRDHFSYSPFPFICAREEICANLKQTHTAQHLHNVFSRRSSLYNFIDIYRWKPYRIFVEAWFHWKSKFLLVSNISLSLADRCKKNAGMPWTHWIKATFTFFRAFNEQDAKLTLLLFASALLCLSVCTLIIGLKNNSIADSSGSHRTVRRKYCLTSHFRPWTTFFYGFLNITAWA